MPVAKSVERQALVGIARFATLGEGASFKAHRPTRTDELQCSHKLLEPNYSFNRRSFSLGSVAFPWETSARSGGAVFSSQ